MKNQFYYETMYILRPDIAEEEVDKHIQNYNKLLEEFDGKVLDSQMRGKRRLAYPIAKNKEGFYVQLSHNGDGQHIFKLEKAMRLSEDVIRYMTVKQEGTPPKPRISNKLSQKETKKENTETDPKEKVLTKKENTETDPKEKVLTKKENIETDPKEKEKVN